MEKQQTKLLEAARVGSIASLQQLLKEDPLILDRAAVNCFNETPLHVAAMLGHVDFAREILALKPELVNELNSDGSSPLHLASAKGHADTVEALLHVDTRACMHRDRNQMLPLHLAAAKGRVEAMLLLLQARPEAAAAYRGGESILHLCVKRYQVEALRVIVKSSVCSSEFLNSKDGDGNTVLHLAVAEKQVETVTLLVSVGGVEVNAVNNEGMKALDVLIRSRRDVRDSEIEKSLIELDGTTSQEKKQSGSWHAATAASSSNNNNNNKNNRKSLGLMKRQAGWLDRKKDALMVVASVIATMAFQVGVNPPGSVWQEDKFVDEHGKELDDPHKAGESIWGYKYTGAYLKFYIANAVAFIASLSIILLLTSGLPMRRGFFVWILMVVTWIAITAIALCYVHAIDVVMPSKHYETFTKVVLYTVLVWIGLMALLLIAHTIRMIVHTIRAIVRFVKKIRNAWMRMRARRHSSLTSQNP